MEPVHVAHLIVLSMWLGVVITEALFEFAASDAQNPLRGGAIPLQRRYVRRAADIVRRTRHRYDPVGARLAIDAPALHQDCGIVSRSGLQPEPDAAGVPAAENRGRERAARIPAAHLEPGGGWRGLRVPSSLSRVGPFPPLRDVSRYVC